MGVETTIEPAGALTGGKGQLAERDLSDGDFLCVEFLARYLQRGLLLLYPRRTQCDCGAYPLSLRLFSPRVGTKHAPWGFLE